MKVILEIKKEQMVLIRSCVLPIERITYRWNVWLLGRIIVSTPWFNKIQETTDNRIKPNIDIQ